MTIAARVRARQRPHDSYTVTRPRQMELRAREWLSRSMIAVEAPGWQGATKATSSLVCN
jgi:hypothetical protein